jgi:hypothetical protein
MCRREFLIGRSNVSPKIFEVVMRRREKWTTDFPGLNIKGGNVMKRYMIPRLAHCSEGCCLQSRA